mmetsp:Transcript_15601/g.17313  ORF Transcript_15601/g.17313 Transcript_15601/m.17313 type:complete len:523 (+) Transcript_15601:321-1889(+)
MGTYLSSPIVEKGVESGECLDDKISPLAWGMVDMQGWRKSMEDAHIADTAVKILPHLLPENTDSDVKEAGKIFGVFDGHGGPEVARFCQLYLVDVLTKQQRWQKEIPVNSEIRDPASTPVGESLIESFHALDRMIDDISRRDELIRLKTDKPQQGERRTTDTNSIPMAKSLLKSEPAATGRESRSVATATTVTTAPLQLPPETKTEAASVAEKTKTLVTTSAATARGVTITSTVNKSSTKEHNKTCENETEAESIEDDAVMEEKEEESSEQDSTNVIGREEVEKLDRDDDEQENDGSEDSKKEETAVVPTTLSAVPTGVILPTIIQNGRQICNLPDHPIHAGCTAVVAVLIGSSLTIANAGDSRAVLCRAGGCAEPLSFDHKPHQEREMNRITKAGGFVNQFGRVNGNLNLSRSIGDLKYKKIPGLEPSEQMITAEPDIVQVLLQPKDEFIILGCDGIWDCLSNDQAVKFVRDRIDTKTPIEIGTEMLDEIISDDPRATQGIGGDNMTVLIVDLQPSLRAYR